MSVGLPPVTQIRLGIIGYGSCARVFHLPFIERNPTYRLVAILEPRSPEEQHPQSHCTTDYPGTRWYRTLDEFCADPEIDLAVVTTPNESHASIARKVLGSGKHVVVDKPVTCTSDEASELISLAREVAKVFAPFQNRRYDSDWRTLLSILPYLGEIHEMIIHKDKNSPEWAISDRSTSVGPGAGAAMGMGSHSVDWCLALFGRPASITAFYRTLRPIESPVEDSFTMILQYGEAAPPIEDVGYSPIIALAPAVRKNLLVTNKTNVYSNMVPLRFVIRGREGSFVKYGEDPQDAQIVAGIMPDDPRFGLEDDTIHGELSTATKALDSQRKSLLYSKGDMGMFYRDVANAVMGAGTLTANPETARDGIRLIELARESSQLGRTVDFTM